MYVRTVILIMITFWAMVINAMEDMDKRGSTNNFASCKFSTSGKIAFNKSTQNKNIPLIINDAIHGNISLYHSNANDVDSLRGGFLLENFTNKNETIQYHVILKDDKGPVAQTKGSFSLKKGKQSVKMSNIVLHPKIIKTISSYEIKMVGVK